MSLVFFFSTLVSLVIFVLTDVSEGHRTIVAFLQSADVLYVVLGQRNSFLFY
jgi:hypothetical protein